MARASSLPPETWHPPPLTSWRPVVRSQSRDDIEAFISSWSSVIIQRVTNAIRNMAVTAGNEKCLKNGLVAPSDSWSRWWNVLSQSSGARGKVGWALMNLALQGNTCNRQLPKLLQDSKPYAKSEIAWFQRLCASWFFHVRLDKHSPFHSGLHRWQWCQGRSQPLVELKCSNLFQGLLKTLLSTTLSIFLPLEWARNTRPRDSSSVVWSHQSRWLWGLRSGPRGQWGISLDLDGTCPWDGQRDMAEPPGCLCIMECTKFNRRSIMAQDVHSPKQNHYSQLHIGSNSSKH